MAVKEYIVAIELGSAKVTGIAGRKTADGTIAVAAMAQENAQAFMRKGTVYKKDQAVKAIRDIVAKLESKTKQKIARVYVGVGGQSMRSVLNTVKRSVPEGAEGPYVEKVLVYEMEDANRQQIYPDLEIIDIHAQEYKVDNHVELDPIGIKCQTLEGNYLNIMYRHDFLNNVNACFKEAGLAVEELWATPAVLADSVLTDSEKRAGCVLIDLGAATTSVAVYYKSILRHLVVLPLGSANVTKDLTSLHIDEETAEKMKLKYASAYTEESDIDETLEYAMGEAMVKSSDFIRVVEARMQEIIVNVFHHIPDEYTGSKLLGGIVLTGGGANMKNIEVAFRKNTTVDKIRVASFVNHSITSSNADATAHNGMMNAALSILAKGNVVCTSGELHSDRQLEFDATAANANATTQPTAGKGSVYTLTPEEKEAIEKQKRAEEEEQERERIRQEEEARLKAEEEERRRKEKSVGSWAKKIKNAFGALLTED